MKIFTALSLGERMYGRCPACFMSQDFTVSPDWSQVTKYDEKEDENGEHGPWSSTAYCLTVDTKENETSAHVYKPCGHKDNVQPPDPPVLKELRD